MNLNHLLLKPLVTEKTLAATKLNSYCFTVAPESTKSQIKAAVQQTFKVNVVEIRTSIIKGVRRRTGRRRLPARSPLVKKAIVQLKAGQSIALFESKG